MKNSLLATALCGALIHLAIPVVSAAQGNAAALDRYLTRVGLTAAERTSVIGGKPIAKLLASRNERDVAVFGIIRVRVPQDTAVARMRQTERWLGSRGNQFGIFSTTPAARDVRGVSLEASEYRDLRKCRRGDCNFKLPATAMKWLVDKVDWSADDAKAQADARVRTAMLNFANDYLATGNKALVTFEDQGNVRAADVFDSLLTQSSDLYEYAPELQRYLRDFPANRPKDARDVLYWSDDRVPHLRPTLSINHLVTYSPVAGLTVIAKKQIYASHYFEGGFELIAIVDGGTPKDPATYLITVRRFRFDNLPGGILNIRGRVREQMTAVTSADLVRDRDFVEHP
jgi:hypothetical protein